MNPTFIIEMENGQTMKGELYPETAPISVANFVELANSGFYDGVILAVARAVRVTASRANLRAMASTIRLNIRAAYFPWRAA